ncbi:Toxin-antitoxin system, antitoxin component, ParD-like [Desulfonema limicola]|uniref:Toxin-antitoxin system, antitoxin component, ParD-like n=1 Tax=Desulfonema limicola TaxID=45656 RepID=A0A975GGG4_9BACT|nr:hypothetical protein [Desulfonema limicola]QTA80219.1 Toxin-antitoxin system, antitoxin component, ParD-like [Desulfonema limicola]
MSLAVKISDELADHARIRSKIFKRSVSDQIEYWAKIGKTAEENPDLPMNFITDILIGKEQIKSGMGVPYKFGE